MDIVKVIAILIIISVAAFGGVLLVHTSRLEKEIQAEIAAKNKGGRTHEGGDDEI